eukprot:CAMPEP_0183344094 /NCGR_PEP_ID=MMETSP0164_2-20130417/9854_1 /TAXON_ID=221442 /ORGANISM="Coccolithus pelagicus ssp braarudi, Strain PLY182g" /LENGTH=67 /DNA_ID=CAMNT_0025515039 /DNA_START=306 /DNA_END=506 /DNA_ORIENTATION=+
MGLVNTTWLDTLDAPPKNVALSRAYYAVFARLAQDSDFLSNVCAISSASHSEVAIQMAASSSPSPSP